MARMLPARVYSATKSRGELDVFQRLRDDPGTDGWIVLHSLDIAQHIKRLSGEADFVIVVPTRGVLCLEVKAANYIRRADGLWYYGSNPEPDALGPFKQASEAMHSIRNRLVSKHHDLSSVLFWSAVVFPYLEFNLSSDEWHDWQVIGGTTFRQQPLSQSILAIFNKAREHIQKHPSGGWFRPQAKEPTKAQSELIAATLRPDFEFFTPPKLQIEQVEGDIKKYTEEQFVALDAMESNPRVVFKGPAGTGKTLLAVEAAKRSFAAGLKVLLLCFNRQLGHRLEDDTTALQPQVTVAHLHKYMLAVAGGNVLVPNVTSEFWQNELPEKAMQKLLEDNSGVYLFDELIVDEAQDLLRYNYLDFLDLSLKGGLNAGRWRLFGDFEKQAIYSSAADISLDKAIATRLGHPTIFALRTNCRNTPRIATLVHLLGDLSPTYSRILRPDNKVEPKIKYYGSAEEQALQLTEILETLLKDGFSYSDIVVLSPKANDLAIASNVVGEWANHLHPFEGAAKKHVRYGTIHSFKGLESRAVIVTDVDQIIGEAPAALFYIAITRALHRLSILASRDVRAEVLKILVDQ